MSHEPPIEQLSINTIRTLQFIKYKRNAKNGISNDWFGKNGG